MTHGGIDGGVDASDDSTSFLVLGLTELEVSLSSSIFRSDFGAKGKSAAGHSFPTPNLTHLLQGLQSSHLVLALLQPLHAVATRLPEAIRCAVRMALLKDLLLLRASMGTVMTFFFTVLC